MPFETIHAVAGGSITVSSFVKLSTAADNTVLLAGSNDPVIGVSSEGAQDAPISGASVTAAESGDSLRVYPIGSVCTLTLGSGGATRAGELIADSAGLGVARSTTSTAIQNVGAIALESGSAGEKIKVMVVRYPLRPALV